ncbi:MAG: alpha/beta fold hydrolase, partial [Chloroflexi bacterium]|nr:alpha/beta fold hydrolase [Chloroflexota bacterium]
NTWNLGCTGKFTWPIPDKGLKKRMHRIQAPTLVVWGQQDGIAPAIYARDFTDRIAGSRSEIIDRAAHIPQLEQLATVSQMVQDFLRT